MMMKQRWGDVLDEEEIGQYVTPLPAPTETGPDSRGVKTFVSWKRNDKGELVKMTTRVRVAKMEKKTYKVAEERRKWKPFGAAVTEKEGESVSVHSHEDVPFERVRQKQATQDEKKQDLKTAMQGSDKAAIVGNLREVLYQKRMQRELARARGEMGASERPPEEEDVYGGGASALPMAGSKGGYVPPSLKNRGAGDSMGDSMRRREENSLRVTNLSEDTREDDLRELFSKFGPISRIYIAYDRDTGENRGFGFVNFTYREDAQKAMNKLNGYGYDNLILRVEWAQPRAERP